MTANLTIRQQVESRKDSVLSLMPSMGEQERMRLWNTAVAIAASPTLGKCTPVSIIKAVNAACMVGLTPNTPHGHAYIVPYGNEATYVLGYQGILALARQSGSFDDVAAEIVWENDDFKPNGHFKEPDHVPYYLKGADRGERPLCVYVVWRKGTKVSCRIVEWAKIEKRREAALSKFRNKDNPNLPWNQWPEEMALKTAIKIASAFWPKSDRFAAALDADEGDAPPIDDTEVIEVDTNTGEVKQERVFGFNAPEIEIEPLVNPTEEEQSPFNGDSDNVEVPQTQGSFKFGEIREEDIPF